MATINVAQFEDAFVIHFVTEGQRINAYTLASTLVGIADAAKAANASINHGYDIEIVVEAVGPGSFRALLRAVYKESGNLFSAQAVSSVVLSVIASFIFQLLSPPDKVKIEIHADEVVVEQGHDRIIIPRTVYDATRIAEQNGQFKRAISKTLEGISADDKVKGIAFVPKMDSPPPDVIISQETIREIALTEEDDPETRVVKEQCDLQIVKAILERSTRKWEFMWRGVKISAPVNDSAFHTKFSDHMITIAPGDGLKVVLAMKQSRDPRTGIYTNVAYEVVEVLEHMPRLRQTTFSGGAN